MKILALSNLYPPEVLGGYEVACSQVVEGLRRRGHAVEVLTASLRRHVPDEPHVHRRFELTDEWGPSALGGDPVIARLRVAASRGVNAYNVHVLTEALAEFAPDVVYVNNVVGLGGLGLVGCLQLLDVPWVWHLGDTIPRELCSTADGVLPPLALEFARGVAGSFVVVSRRVHDECHADGLALNGRVELVPYWVAGERPPARTRFYDGGTLRVMSAGRVDRQKGSDVLVRAAALVRESGEGDLAVDLYGSVVDPSIGALIGDLGLTGTVRLMGPRPQEEILGLYGGYDLLAFPTRRREPFGMVVLEAASRGCVPVMSADCGVGEWLAHGVHGLKAEPTPEGFAAAFRRVLRGEVPLGPLARRAEEAAWRDFHLDNVLPRVEAVLADAPRRAGPRRARAADPGAAYRLARMAELITQSLIQESLSA